jgi:hypothetical protein
MNVNVGVINPYALGELIAQRNIDWDKVVEPEKLLSEILKVDKDVIFDIKNPILSPQLEIQGDGNFKQLTDVEAEKRLKSFLGIRAASTSPRILSSGLRLNPAIESKISELFFSSSVQVSSSGTAWAPADKEWIDKGDYFEDVGELTDPIQGALGDCYFIAALSSVVWARPYAIVNMIRPSGWGDEESPIHLVNFYKDGTGSPQAVEVSEKVPVAKTSHTWAYARSLDISEIWPAVMEKAYAKWRTGNTTDFPNYPAIAGGDPVMACAQIIRGTRTYKATSSTNSTDLYTFVRANSLSRRTVNPMVAWTYGSQPAGTNYASAKVVANHAYSVLGWDYSSGEEYVVLRNPWGTHHATLDTRGGTWSAHQVSHWAPVPLNANGVFSMKVSTFRQYFAGIGVAV